MTVSREVEAEIARLFHAEHWKVGTIAAQLGVHEDVVRRVIRGRPKGPRPKQAAPSTVAPYVGFIREMLERYPKLCSTRLQDMLHARGYEGSARTLRRFVQTVRPKSQREAFVRLDALIGEEAQIDWAYVAQLPVEGGGHRSLWLFLMVLSWSRAAWGEFCFDTTVHSLLRSLVRGASYFGGTPRRWLFDNAKVVVLERHGQASRYHPLLVDLARAMRVELRLCNPYRGNEKGRVERKIRFLRQRFLEGRDLYGIEQGNRELLGFLEEIAHAQRHPDLRARTIADCLAQERQRLLPLPDPLPTTDLVQPVAVDKTALARFDTNLYSAPTDYAQETLTLVADERTVRLLDGQRTVAEHRRSWGHGLRIESPDHRAEIGRRKRRRTGHRCAHRALGRRGAKRRQHGRPDGQAARGPSGVGKTTLAKNLGLSALAHGYSVRFCTLASMLADLLRRDSLPAFERRLRRYVRPRLLILDEIGYLPCDNRSADLLYNIVSRRHEARSIVITTNLPFRQWGTVFPGAACVAALVDRFVQHCHVLDIDAESWRQKTSLQHHNGRSVDGQDSTRDKTR